MFRFLSSLVHGTYSLPPALANKLGIYGRECNSHPLLVPELPFPEKCHSLPDSETMMLCTWQSSRPVACSHVSWELWRGNFKTRTMNNDTNAQLAMTTYIRVEVPFPENTSGSPLKLPGSFKLLTHLSRKHNNSLLWGNCVHGIYRSFGGLIIYSLFSKVNICKLHKSNPVWEQYFSSKKKQHVSPSTPLCLPHRHPHRHKDARHRNLVFVYIWQNFIFYILVKF